MASYFFTEVRDSAWRSSSASLTSPSASSMRPATASLARLSASVPLSASQPLSWETLFGLSRPVTSAMRSRTSDECSVSMAMACSTRTGSTATPRSLMRWSRYHSRHSASGTGQRSSLRLIARSTTTSWRLYSTNCAHFSGSLLAVLRVAPPFFLVGLHGLEKYLISALPAVSLPSVSCRALAVPSRSPGSAR